MPQRSYHRYPITYKAIRDRVRKRVLHTKLARKIMRKSGFRPRPEEGSGSGGVSVLTIPPVTPVGGCPKGAFDPAGEFESAEDWNAFYVDAKAAEVGDQTERDEFRDEWISGYLDMEDDIIRDYIFDFLTYDYAGETATLTLFENDGCSVEIDIGRDPGSFWEQYKGDDSRFSAENVFVNEDQDIRFLCSAVALATDDVYESGSVRSNTAGAPPDDPEYPYDVCTDGTQYWTHERNELLFPDTDKVQTCTLYRKSYSAEEITGSFNVPNVWITSDKMLGHKSSPLWDTLGIGNSAAFGVLPAEAMTDFPGPPYDLSLMDGSSYSPVNAHESDAVPWPVDSNFWECLETTPDLDYEQEYFCAMRSSLSTDDAPNSTDTYEDRAVWKEAPTGRQMVDWSEGPGERYFHTWPTYRITDVRVVGAGPSQPV